MKRLTAIILSLILLGSVSAQSKRELRAMISTLNQRIETLENTLNNQQNDLNEAIRKVKNFSPQVTVGNDEMLITSYQGYIDSLRSIPFSSDEYVNLLAQDEQINFERWDSLVNKAGILIINKETMTISRIDYKGKVQCTYGIACGRNYGDKRSSDDWRTPEGIFRIKYISDLRVDSLIRIFGPHFMCLDTPGWDGIGVHGTGVPSSIGKRVSHGCIRLHNEDVRELRKWCYVGMPVVILPSRKDVAAMKIEAPDGPEPSEAEQLKAEQSNQ